MLPLQQAYEVKESILEYIRTTFRIKDRDVNDAFYKFINDPLNGIFRGPFISVRAPYKSEPDASIPLEIKPNFPPYHHQAEAFNKLSTQEGHKPENTILTTGTGSGKTECFAFPILDYCFTNQSKKGIKVIILYPMNALATDQAKRFAELIWNDERLKGKITCGLYIGKGKNSEKGQFASEMGEENVIESQETIENTPPDILLTNFKMLDMALMLGERDHLWHYNKNNNELLRYLILDELHTYDGAQGTDVANLIRRLKLKLKIPTNYLCAVGTSATIGDGENSKRNLCKYAMDVFGEPFTEDDIIGETRMPINELFTGDAIHYMPPIQRIRETLMQSGEGYGEYIERLKEIWQCSCSSPVELSGNIARLQITRDLISITDREKVESLNSIIDKLAFINPEFAALPEIDTLSGINPRLEAIASLLALIANAKRNTGKPMPYLSVQVQLWVRELSGIRRYVSEVPKFTWNNQISQNNSDEIALPMYYCRECGASGWLGLYNERDDCFSKDCDTAAVEFMKNNRNVFLINLTDDTLGSHRPVGNYSSEEQRSFFLGIPSLEALNHKTDNSIRVWASRKLVVSAGGDTRSSKCCPECDGQGDSVGIVGMQTASISSLSISQILTSDLDETGVRGRKLLAFTNSVQDAAHDAAFFEARNYRFSFRTAVQKVLNQLNDEVSLSKLYDEFCTYWKNALASPEEKYPLDNYLYRFLPSDLEGKVDFQKDGLDSSKTNYKKSFVDEFDFRISWEICSEFGLNAHLGRSLEKTGCATAFFREADIIAITESMKPWLKANNLYDIMESQGWDLFHQFVNVLLHRMRLHGSVDHPTLDAYRESEKISDLHWFNHHHWMHKVFGRRSKYPKLIHCDSLHNNSTAETTYRTKAQNWFHNYYEQCFLFTPHDDISRVNDFYQALYKNMTSLGMTKEVKGSEGVNYAINSDKIFITTKAAHYRCACCQSLLSTNGDDKFTFESHCMNYRCPGIYNIKEPIALNYYHNVYNRRTSLRIYSREHTGLLKREVRERLEDDFINHPRPNSCNTLVATSTLEMGIDIGDLNTTLNTSVPPRPSNFLQRIGRAGRKTGTALILNYARRKKHDLFYFSDPKEMMKGEVSTPGCFLAARDILKRHFLAYCIDSWASLDSKENVIPVKLLLVEIHKAKFSALNPTFFVSKIIDYINKNIDQLCNSFSLQYEGEIKTTILPDLFVSYRDGSMLEPLRSIFMSKHEEYMELTNTYAEIKKRMENLSDNDDEKKDLKLHARFIYSQKEAIKETNTLEFLTDQGLLPNYAFPETGVTLNASISTSHRNDKGEVEWDEPESIELVRSASSALSELAPSNHFYFQGYKLDIDGLNTFDWNQSKTSAKKRKRYCSNCDYIMDDVEGVVAPCPKCGDTSITSADNLHTFVNFTGAKSYMQKKRAISDDSDDERKTESFRSTLHFDFTQKAVSLEAWGLTNAPFGIEFCKNVSITNVNLGRIEEHSSNHTTINGISNIPRSGFVTCNVCGKSTSLPSYLQYLEPKKKLQELHYPFCKNRNVDYQGQENETFSEVYLYRELLTEVIKILLPIDQFETEAHLVMFKAGIELGLRKCFEGNPEHIRIANYREFNKLTSRFDQYLVLYDTIPGGTGYLATLIKPEKFTELLKLSYEALRDCTCQWDGKDGCYKCILSYGNQKNQDKLSRERAEELFCRLYNIAIKEGFKKMDTLGGLSKIGGQEESELEEWFIECIKRGSASRGWTFATDAVNGEKNYKLSINTSSYNIVYKIFPQRWLGETDNVSRPTRPDFLFRCVNYQLKNETSVGEDHHETVPSIAIFTDGFRYHGAFYEGKIRYKDDYIRREAVRNSGHIIPWTLSWEDLKFFESPNRDCFNDENQTPIYESLSINRFYQDTANIVSEQFGPCDFNNLLNNMERLFFLLEHNDMIVSEQGMKHCLEESIGQFFIQWNEELKPYSLDDLTPYLNKQESTFAIFNDPLEGDIEEGEVFIPSNLNQNNEWFHLNIAVKLNGFATSFKIKIPDSSKDCDPICWNRFWRTYNLLSLCTNNADRLDIVDEEDDEIQDLNIDSLLEEFDDMLHGTIRKLIANKLNFHHSEYSLMDSNDQIVIAQALLVIKSPKIAVISDEDCRAPFEELGFKVFSIDNIDKIEKELGI